MSDGFWISVTEQLPTVGAEVLVAGEQAYTGEKPRRFVDIGMYWGEPNVIEPDRPIDTYRWSTINDWYEGEQLHRITHWAEIPKHPLEV